MIDLSRFTPDSPEVFVIAEAGVNHNGCIGMALKLVDAAIMAGCDAVKFQLWNTDNVYPASRVGAEKHAEMKALELSREHMEFIKSYCDSHGIVFFATPDELDDARFLASLGVPLMKTSSHDVTNLEMLRGIRELGVPTIMSTGAATIEEVDAAVAALRPEAILHCVSAYPVPLHELNLSVIEILRERYSLPVGWSDHSHPLLGPYAAGRAWDRGARIFERHVTLSRKDAGPDHLASAEPAELFLYAAVLRSAGYTAGCGTKDIMPCERAAREKFKPWLVS